MERGGVSEGPGCPGRRTYLALRPVASPPVPDQRRSARKSGHSSRPRASCRHGSAPTDLLRCLLLQPSIQGEQPAFCRTGSVGAPRAPGNRPAPSEASANWDSVGAASPPARCDRASSDILSLREAVKQLAEPSGGPERLRSCCPGLMRDPAGSGLVLMEKGHGGGRLPSAGELLLLTSRGRKTWPTAAINNRVPALVFP